MQLQRLVINADQLHDGKILLNLDQVHYLVRVLRLRQGDRFIAMDGQGQTWTAKLVEVNSTAQLGAEILESIEIKTELSIALTLVIALPKNGFDEVVRQVTELGVNCIAPVISDRTLLNPSSQKLERWRRIAQEAAEQSERQVVPTISEPISFSQYLQESCDRPSTKYLCVTRHPAAHLLTHLQLTPHPTPHTPHPTPHTPHPLILAIGPEGGWTDAEVDQAIATGYQPVSLGSRILRTVTAPVVALSLIAAIYERE